MSLKAESVEEDGVALLNCISDHGDMHGSHGYREKSMPWEESIRIPFFITGDLRTRTGRLDSVLNLADDKADALEQLNTTSKKSTKKTTKKKGTK